MTNPAEVNAHPEQQKNIDPALQSLAQRVKTKDQALFERITKIVEANARKSTQEQKAALRSELSSVEKQTISDIAKSEGTASDVREVAKQVTESDNGKTAETVATTAGLSAVAATIATKVNSMPDQLGIKDSLKEWLKEMLLEAPDPEDGIWGKLVYGLEHMFLAPLAMALGIDFSKKDEKDGKKDGESDKSQTEKPAENTEEPEKPNEALNEAWFIAGYKWFVRIYKNSIKPDVDLEMKSSKLDNLFNYSAFQNLTFQQAEDLYNKYGKADKTGLLQDAKMENITDIDADTLYLGLGLIVKSDGTNFLRQKYADGMSTKTVREIFEGIKDRFNIAENLETIEINSVQDVTGFMGEVWKKMDLELDANGQVKSAFLKEKVHNLWLDKADLVTYIMAQSSDTSIMSFSTPETISGLHLDVDSQKKLWDIIRFGKTMQQSIAQSFSFGYQQKYTEYLTGHPLTLLDAFKMYVILGDNTDQSMMSPAEQLYVYQKVFHILGKDSGFRGKYFDEPMASALWDSQSQITIPDQVKKIMYALMQKAWETFKNNSENTAKELWEILPAAAVGAVGGLLVAYVIWGNKIWLLATGAWLASLTFSIAAILKQFAWVDGKITLKSGEKMSTDKAAKVIAEDIERQIKI